MRPGAHMASHPSRVQGSGPIGRNDVDGRRPAERRHGSRRRAFRRAHVIPFLVLASLVVGILGGPASPVGADELSDARARQAALSQQLKTQKAAIAEINAMQADLGGQIASTKRQLNGINANLVEVRSNINVDGPRRSTSSGPSTRRRSSTSSSSTSRSTGSRSRRTPWW